MPRSVVNAILDRVVDTEDLVEKAVAEAEPAKKALGRAARAILAGAGGDPASAREAFRSVFREVVVASFASHIPDALVVVREAVKAEARSVKALGAHRLREIQPLRKPDVMRRRMERAGATPAAAGEGDGAR